MARPPAYIFVVRHGNRLDAADKLWHLSSPTPYDPPLTYGGWSQCRALGQRIADILREGPPAASPDEPASKRRKYKVVIHSSPFLRCIQTSIAISSGIASDALPLESPRAFAPLPLPRVRAPAILPGSPKLHKSVMRIDAFLGEWLSPGYFELITPPPGSVMMVASAKAQLLSREDYSSFTHSTAQQAAHTHSNSTSQLWAGPRSNAWSARLADEAGAASGAQPLSPPVGLFNSSADGRPTSSSGGLQSPRWGAANGAGMHPPGLVGYVAPVPHLGLSSRAPTPAAYVAHARDACVDLDYQWDSMRAPYDWGDGGEFGEEWTAMHRRFRKGLQKLVDWYSTTDAPAEMVTKTVQFSKPGHAKANSHGSIVNDAECAIDDDDDDDGSDAADSDCIEETVVVLVSHGAGCNALIGAITQQPVLVDVGLASLSMAVRRPGKESLRSLSDDDAHASKWTGAVHSGHPGGIVPLSQFYEMKLLASSDHLRSVPTTPTTPRGGSMASVMGGTRVRHSNSVSGTPGHFSLLETGTVGQRSPSAGFSARLPSGAPPRPVITKTVDSRTASPSGTAARASSGVTVGSGVLSFSPPTLSTGRAAAHSRSPSIGLWSPVSSSSKELDEDSFALALGDDNDDGNDSDMEILLSFGPESPKPPPPPPPPTQPPVKKKAPSIREKGNFSPSSLSIAHSVDGDHDDEKNGHKDGATASDAPSSDATATATATRPALLRLDTKTASNGTLSVAAAAPARAKTPTTTPPRAASPSSPSLWVHPRLFSLSSDEPTHERASSKRRWTVTEPPAQ